MKGDKILSFAILLQALLAIVQLLLPMYGITSVERAADIRVFTVLVLFLPAIIEVVKRNLKSLVIPFVIYFLILIFHYLLFPASHVFIESSKSITLTPITILTGIFIYNLKSIEPFKEVFIWVSRFSVPMGILFIWGHLNSPYLLDESNYDMSFGYTLLLPTLYLFTSNKIIDKVSSVLLWALIVYGASRGPAVVAAVFYIISILFFGKRKNIKLWQAFVFVAVVIAGVIVLPQYLDFQASRTVYLFENGEGITHDSDRSLLYSKALSIIWESPIIGNGIGSDWFYMGGYCHNIFLELSMHYGYFISVPLCIVIILLSVESLRNKKTVSSVEDKQLSVLLLMACLMPLLVSSSYLLNSNFGLIIGYLLRYRYNKRIDERTVRS